MLQALQTSSFGVLFSFHAKKASMSLKECASQLCNTQAAAFPVLKLMLPLSFATALVVKQGWP